MNLQQVIFEDLGIVDYHSAWDYQEELLKQNVQKKTLAVSTDITPSDKVISDTGTIHRLLFVEHPPVYTLGKSGKMENVLLTEEQLNQRSIQFYKTNRGGDITFHGPGQLVGYPVFDLEKFYTDIGRYLRNLEEVIIRTMAEYGLKGERSPGETGVWLDPDIKGQERKICAIGVRCSRWVTMHGFAFNVNTDLGYFNHIIPCGIVNKQVTSLEKELQKKISMEEVKEIVLQKFEEVFEISIAKEEQIADL